MTETTTTGRLLTMDQAAERLSMSTRWVRHMIRLGQIPAVHLGRSVRLYDEDVDAFARRHRRAVDQ
ncbi:helix-turn-helix domain-containing protein [Cellulomonas sp. NTE-D12]|uniref:helix-turn-helix domain-containing protein n=1 Tax=Cellulomonas sp. NTE-D12 TaxID=2962632 RepID=UPI003081F465|nr:hypothetical protein CELD12_26310 [Cellulomonas sp. NTE-D12]